MRVRVFGSMQRVLAYLTDLLALTSSMALVAVFFGETVGRRVCAARRHLAVVHSGYAGTVRTLLDGSHGLQRKKPNTLPCSLKGSYL